MLLYLIIVPIEMKQFSRRTRGMNAREVGIVGVELANVVLGEVERGPWVESSGGQEMSAAEATMEGEDRAMVDGHDAIQRVEKRGLEGLGADRARQARQARQPIVRPPGRRGSPAFGGPLCTPHAPLVAGRTRGRTAGSHSRLSPREGTDERTRSRVSLGP